MQTDPETIKKHFQKSIDKYISNAVVQEMTAERLVSKIRGENFESILEIGAGAGLLTKKLAQNCTFNQYLANDLVEESEHYVKKYIPTSKFISGDFESIKFNEKFNMIASNAVFQWFENSEDIFNKCSKLLNPNGLLAFSTFSPENFTEFKEITGLSLKYKTPEEITTLLEPRFKIVDQEAFDYTMKFETPLEILVHMKNTGVNSIAKRKWNIKDIKNFCKNYKQRFPDCTLTYSPIIVIAKLK